MAREKFTERIGVIIDKRKDGSRVISPIERGSVRDSGFALIAILAGGADIRPERSLRAHTRTWNGFRIFGHNRHDGRTFVTVHCPHALLMRLRELTFVIGLLENERGAAGASQCHLRR